MKKKAFDTRSCHPERSEGSQAGGKKEILRLRLSPPLRMTFQKTFSATFMTALIGMSAITHAGAEEEIEKLYRDESMLTCWQAGREVIHEPFLVQMQFNERSVSGVRPDGTYVFVQTFPAGSDAICSVVTRKEKE